nr:hypothetical protein Q903MT_gene32 [Picea sitchensis]
MTERKSIPCPLLGGGLGCNSRVQPCSYELLDNTSTTWIGGTAGVTFAMSDS